MSSDQYIMRSTHPAPAWRDWARRALAEDRAHDDVTTRLLGGAAARPAAGRLRSEGQFVLAGLPLVEAVFAELHPAIIVEASAAEGSWIDPGHGIASVRGPASVLLAGERVMLNYVQHLSGIATATKRAVDAVAGTGAVITDTRKTTPGLREIEKYAVRVGGGVNHRYSLADAVLWKDNHWAMLRRAGVQLRDCLDRAPADIPVEVEVEDEAQLEEALSAAVAVILVDNQSPATVSEWVRRAGPDVVVEASGGIRIERVAEYAKAGARRISLGSLTYSPHAAPVTFEIDLDEGSDEARR